MKRIIFFSILFLASCSLYVKNDKSSVEKALKENQTGLNFCPIKKSASQFFGASKNLVKSYQKLLKTLKSKKIRLSFIDKYVLYALMQMNARPDQASPTSRHQVFIYHKGKDHYFDFFAKKNSSYPFLYGLNKILRYFSSKYSLKTLASYIDLYQKEPILVSENFYTFLKQGEKRIKESNLKKFYLRGGQILRPGESIPKLNLKKLITRYKKNVGQFKTLIKYIPGKDSKIKIKGSKIYCNFDLNLYERSLYLSKGPMGDSANYGLFNKGSLALGVNSQSLKTFKRLGKTGLFKGTGTPYLAKFCKINNMVFISSKGKDPAQQLFHFLERNVQFIDSFENIDDLITSARHLYLVDPLRIIYESRRGSKLGLDNLRKSGLPIYNSSNLGYVWAWGEFDRMGSLFKDPRAQTYLSCPKTVQQ